MKYLPARFPALAALLLFAAVAPLLAAEWNTTIRREVEQIVSTEMARRGIPGLSIAIGIGDGPIWSQGYGLADVENSVPVTASTVFRLGSISKPISAIVVLQQVEAGKLNLDEDVHTYVSSFPQRRWKVTPRLLLGHLGGIRTYRGDEMESTKHYESVSDGLAIFAADPLEHQPGTKYLYSSYGFNLVGAAAEAAAGVPFRQLLTERVFQPAGMSHTRDDSHFAIIPHRVRGYRKSENGGIENCALADTSNKIPGGGMIASAADIVRFGRAVLADKLVTAETRTLMWTPQATADGKKTVYGMGWNVSSVNGELRVWHGGGQPGTATFFDVVPSERIVIAILTNLQGSAPKEISDRLLDVLLRKEGVLPTGDR